MKYVSFPLPVLETAMSFLNFLNCF